MSLLLPLSQLTIKSHHPKPKKIQSLCSPKPFNFIPNNLSNNAHKFPLLQASNTPFSSVSVEKDSENDTVFVIRAKDKMGLLNMITRVLKGFRIENPMIEFDDSDGFYVVKFFVTDLDGKKIEDQSSLDRIENGLLEGINGGEGIVLKKGGYFGGKSGRMFDLMDGFLKNDPISLEKDILYHVEYSVARSRFSFDDFEAYQALSHSVRDRLIERWHDTQQHFKKKDPKRLYFLSLEFLMGRSLSNSVINLGIRDQCAEALSQLGFEYEVLAEQEGDAALGNGGLARLSACQMDSLATLDYPAWGYGLRYQYGLFRQIILDGFQHEQPDYWLNFGNPWEIERVHVSYPVKFYGTVNEEIVNGKKRKVWIPKETVEAVAYDNPIPGYGTRNTVNLRLWSAKPSDGNDFVILTHRSAKKISVEDGNVGKQIQQLLAHYP